MSNWVWNYRKSDESQKVEIWISFINSGNGFYDYLINQDVK